MTLKEAHTKTALIVQDILNNKLAESFQLTKTMLEDMHYSELNDRYQTQYETYQNMLRYSFEYNPDPQREKIYRHLQRELTELSDDILESLLEEQKLVSYFQYRQKTQKHSGLSQEELLNEIAKVGLGSQVENDIESDYGDHEAELSRILFYTLWLASNYKESENKLIKSVFETEYLPWQIKSVVVSAITLSLIRHFDTRKFILLYDIYMKEEEQSQQRALIGLLIGLLIYQDRLKLYPEIMDRIKSIPDFKRLQKEVLAFVIQFLRAQDTEKIARKIQEEIIPEVLKIKNELEEKMNLDDMLSQKSFEDKNPEWENVFKDSPDVYKKLEQFSQMHVEGSDVFMSAFAMLKHFDFFRETSNWFLPFHKENKDVQKISTLMGDTFDTDSFVEALEQSSVLCNSDKYSFCLNIQHMPEQQRKMMLDLFNMEMKAMNEMAEDEMKLNTDRKSKAINTQYIQDLYRFFKLYPQRKELTDIFKIKIDVLNSPVFLEIFDDPTFIRNIGEYYFDKDQYNEALRHFLFLNEKDSSYELTEKIGFCFQKLGQYEKAIDFYHRGEIFEESKLWLQKKLGFCYRKIGKFDEAIEYYRKVETTEPDNLDNQAYLGQLHIDKEDYEEALKYYFKVEYMKPDHVKVQRPIAWCSFILEKTDQALRYFKKVAEREGTKNDFLNLGHAYWSKGNLNDAIECYQKAFKTSERDTTWFSKAMKNDSKYLQRHGIEALDVALLSDYLVIM